MISKDTNTNPPSYDVATSDAAPSSSTGSPSAPVYTLCGHSEINPPSSLPLDAKSPLPPSSPQLPQILTSHLTTAPSMPTTRVYHYQNPQTGQVVSSLLPPHHPEMVCLQAGQHIKKTEYGLLGIIAAVIWFPLGIGLCLLDRKVTCKRCGQVVSESICH